MVLGLLLSGCGGGGGSGSGVNSTPAPTYTKLANLTGNQTFQTAGINFTVANGGVPFPYSSQKFGSGVVIAYNAANDSFTLTAPDGTVDTFSSATSSPPPGFVPPPNTVVFFGNSGIFSVVTPVVNGVPLSYTAIGSWNHFQGGFQSVYFAVSGVPTISSDMPKSGTATYQTAVGGTVYTGPNIVYSLQNSSTATFSANFGAGTVATTLNLSGTGLNGQLPTDFGSYSGTGTITSGGPGFSGTLASVTGNPISATGEFSGAFFGPQATEMGYAWYLSNGLNGFGAQGITTGSK